MMIRTAIEIQDNEAIGNKAKSLIELARAGFTVPRTWILPAQVYTEARSGTDPLKNFDWNAWYSAAGHVRLAVRSSCTVEDSNAASFAGLFESYLDIQSAERLREAVYACWNSSESERVRRYAETKGIDLTGLAMSVVIQDYIEPDFAGVAFTLNPMTGDDREMLFEAVEGCGDKLVAGLVTPARYRLSWFADEPLISAHGPLANVTPENLKVLRSALRKVQALKGRPQDVEFAFKHGKLYLLQSRDITRVQIGTEMGEWTTADLRDGGVSATVTTPLMWSFYRMCIQESMSEYFAQLKLFNPRKRPAKFAEVFYGRPYWNLGFVKEIMTAVPGFVERNFDEDLSVQPTYEGDGVTTPLTPLGLVRAIPTVLALGRSFKEQLHIDELVLAQSRSLENFYRAADLTKLTDGRLAKVFTYLCETEYPFVEKNYFKTIYNTSNAKLEFKVSLEKLAKIDPDLRYNELMAGLDQLDVIQPVHELWKLRDLVGANEDLEYRVTSYADGTADAFMAAVQTEHPEFHAAFEEFLSRFYYRAEVELDISVPRWSENPDFVISSLKALVKNGDPVRRPEVSENRKHQIFEEALARAERAFEKGGVFTRLGRKAFHAKLERLRRYAWLREEMRDRSTRTYFFLRRFALECGRRLNERMPGAVKSENDIFYLEFTEIARALSQEMTEKEAASLIEIRRLYADGYRNYRNPNEIGARWNAGAAKASNILAPKNAKSWSGIACSTGVVRGRARVVRNLKEAGKLEKGDILIAPFTDPGWTPLFSIVSGVVTETGGLLSHAALISREYAMPAVLNIPGATGFIRDGQEIVVDGRTGTVHLVEA